MFKRLLFIINGILIVCLGYCQTPITSPVLIGSGGDFFKIENSYSLSYSIGELSIKTLNNGDHILTEGFQQGKPHYPASDIRDILCMPNPVVDYLKMAFYVDDGESFIVQVYNIIGKDMGLFEYNNVLNGNSFNMDLRNYANGLYLVRVQSKDGKIQRTFKIEKN